MQASVGLTRYELLAGSDAKRGARRAPGDPCVQADPCADRG